MQQIQIYTIQPAQRLIHGLFSTTAQLQTSFVDILLKTTSTLQYKIQQIQQKLLKFKQSILGVFIERISQIAFDSDSNFKQKQIAYIEEKRYQIEKKCVTFKIRNMLKLKMSHLINQNNNPLSLLSTPKNLNIKSQQKQQILHKLGDSIKKMQKDLGIINDQDDGSENQMNSYWSKQNSPNSKNNKNFIKQFGSVNLKKNSNFDEDEIKGSVTDNSFEQIHQYNFMKKSFLTNSGKSLGLLQELNVKKQNVQIQKNKKKNEVKKQKLKIIIDKNLQKNTSQLKYTFKAFKCLSALQSLTQSNKKKQNQIIQNTKIQITKTNSIKYPPKANQTIQKTKSSKQQQSKYCVTNNYLRKKDISQQKKNTLSNQNNINTSNSRQKQKRNIVISKGNTNKGGIFQDILKQSYESFISENNN